MDGWMWRKCIVPDLMPQLRAADRLLKPHFTVREFAFDVRPGAAKEWRHLVVCTDTKAVFNSMVHSRGYDTSSVLAKIGIDSGRSFLKVSMSVVTRISESRMTKPEFKDGGVRRLIILAAVENVSETYDNLKVILKLLQLDQIEFVLAADMKVANLVLGLQSASSAHPCP
jgi:hypothetical protein